MEQSRVAIASRLGLRQDECIAYARFPVSAECVSAVRSRAAGMENRQRDAEQRYLTRKLSSLRGFLSMVEWRNIRLRRLRHNTVRACGGGEIMILQLSSIELEELSTKIVIALQTAVNSLSNGSW